MRRSWGTGISNQLAERRGSNFNERIEFDAAAGHSGAELLTQF